MSTVTRHNARLTVRTHNGLCGVNSAHSAHSAPIPHWHSRAPSEELPAQGPFLAPAARESAIPQNPQTDSAELTDPNRLPNTSATERGGNRR